MNCQNRVTLRSMWESLQHIDIQLFRAINMDGSNGFFDLVMPFIRNKYFWIPLYVFLLALLIDQYGKKIWVVLIGVSLLVGVADFTSSELIKKNIKRSRPCQDELLSTYSRTLVHCGSGYSMTSSHATNHMALAVFFFLAIGQRNRILRWPLILWALLVGYAQIYVGVHYPGDVLAGFILGACIGAAIAALTKIVLKLLKVKPEWSKA